MSEKDVVLPLLFSGVPALFIYALGRVLPRFAIICAFPAALVLFVFVVVGGALSASSPLLMLIPFGPFVGLGMAIRHA